MRERVQLDEVAPTRGDCIERAGSGRRRRSLGRSDDRTNVARDGVNGHAPDAADRSNAERERVRRRAWTHIAQTRGKATHAMPELRRRDSAGVFMRSRTRSAAAEDRPRGRGSWFPARNVDRAARDAPDASGRRGGVLR